MCINQNLLQIPSHACIGYYPIGLCRRFPYAEQIAETEGGGGCIHFLHFAHTCACTQEHTNGVMSSMSPTPLPFLFSSFPDPTRGHPRRSCFLLLVWASAAHTPTLLYTLPASLCTHIRTASQSGSSAVQTSLPLCCGGQELDVCVCVNVSMYTDRHRVKGLDETP